MAVLAGVVIVTWAPQVLAGEEVPTKFTNIDGISNTRHNLTQDTLSVPAQILMDPSRNNYEEVCVYCHTPHGANSAVEAPLWNRVASTATYATYDQLGTSTLTQTVTAPGPASVTCLSCHDGTLAIDSIINMPNTNSNGVGNDNYNPNPDTAFLDSWVNASGSGPVTHTTLGDSTGVNQTEGCMACHSPGGIFAGATNFAVMVIGEDLTNDHPIGITYPTAPGVDFVPTNATSNNLAFFDDDADGRADTNEIRLYDSGDGPEVECASCHDPHGVPQSGAGTQHFPTFLRVSNAQSGVCLTCHVK
jgi:hypothetical protein